MLITRENENGVFIMTVVPFLYQEKFSEKEQLPILEEREFLCSLDTTALEMYMSSCSLMTKTASSSIGFICLHACLFSLNPVLQLVFQHCVLITRGIFFVSDHLLSYRDQENQILSYFAKRLVESFRCSLGTFLTF